MDQKNSLSYPSVSTYKRGDIVLRPCGCPVRRIEETLNRLTNENFNLKCKNYKLEEAQRRSELEFHRRSETKIKLEEELRESRRGLKIISLDNQGLRKQLSKLYETQKANEMLEEMVLEKDAILKKAAKIITAYQDGNFKTEMFVKGIRKLLKAYDES